MYNSFDEFYNKSYNLFYNICEHKNCISENPIPYIINEDLEVNGQYLNGTIILKNSSIESPEKMRRLFTDIYHELTHYYDENMFRLNGYSDEDINCLMLTYSEVHAAYNEMFAFFNLRNLTVKKRIDLNKIKFENKTMTKHIAFQIVKELQNMNNPLGFKYAMYLLGHKRAFLKIAKDVLAINRAYNFNQIPKCIREEIIAIDKLIDLTSYENIDTEQIYINKLKVDTELLRISIKSISIPDIEEMEDIKKIISDL